MKDTLGVLLAGGAGERLYPLTRDRAKPAVTFGGIYRIIDITLSNCINSDLRRVYILTQYKALSLNRHIREGWNIVAREIGEFVEVLPPMQRVSDQWYQGTADAVFQNFQSIELEAAEHTLILSGDHIYKMDYNPLLQFHIQTNSDLTLAVRSVSPHDAHRFGMVGLESDGRVTSFEEKPARTRNTLASMGVYVFKREVLVNWLTGEGHSQHDFGREVIPSLLKRGGVYAYTFGGYWMDVGTVQAYWEANIALLAETPALDRYDPDGLMHTLSE